MLQKIEIYPNFVEPFHVDFTGRIFMGVLGNHLLNAAGKHATNRGWGMGALNESQHTWVLSRLSIELEETPRQYEHFEVKTWVESVTRLFTSRNFAILRPDGTAYGYARSIWAMIDLDTRKPCDLISLYDGDICNYAEPDEPCPIDGHGRFRFREAELVRTMETYYSDMDINGHTNSIKYIEHILDLFPRERFEKQRLQRFEIAYKTESYMGDRLMFYTQPVDENEIDVEVRKNVTEESAGEVVCQAKVRFK